MPPRLPPGKREILKNQAFKMSIEDNMSNRAIACELGIDPKTVGNLLKEATQEARQDTSLIYEKTLRARLKLLDHLTQTLEREGVSPHAISQIGHSINSTLDSIDLLVGTRAPSKSLTAVKGRVEHVHARMDQGLDNLTREELILWRRLAEKASAEPEEAAEIDVLGEVAEELRRGTLSLPEPLEVVED